MELQKALQFHLVMFLNDPWVKENYPADLGYESACKDAKELYQSHLEYDSHDNPDDAVEWQWDMFLFLPAALPVVASLLNLRLVSHSKYTIDTFDATSKGSVRYFTGTKAHYQPNYNNMSTFRVLGDGHHYDLVIPFGRVFPKDDNLSEGFIASLQECHLAMQHDTQSAVPPPGPPAPTRPQSPTVARTTTSDESVSTEENEFTDDLTPSTQSGKRPANNTQPSSTQD